MRFSKLKKDYIALIPIYEAEEVFLYRLKNTLDSALEFENIVDNNEFELVAEAFNELTDE